MAVVKITFDGSSVSAAQDAVINHFLCGEIMAGIFEGIGDELSYSVSNNYITFDKGYVQICGRRIYVEAGSQVYISLDSSKYGYVILDVNLSSNSVTLTKVESTSTYPNLIQENLFANGTRYQFPIAKYSKNTSSINLQSFNRTMIPTPLSLADSGYYRAINYVQDKYKVKFFSYPTSQTGSTYKWDLSGYYITKCLLVANIDDNILVPIPGTFLSGNSIFTIYYRVGSTDRTLIGEWLSGNILLLTTNSTSIKVKEITLYQFGD